MSRAVKPTRNELRSIRDRLEFAERGHTLLEKKRDGLVMEFMDVFDEALTARDVLEDAFERAQHQESLVRASEGRVALDGIARARRDHPKLTVSRRNVMGVVIPQITATDISAPLDEHGYGLLGTSPAIDEVVDAYEALLEQVVVAAEIGTALRILLDEIRTTRYRVNALEKVVLPDLRDEAVYIRHHLAERERDERIRQKWSKNRKGRHR